MISDALKVYRLAWRLYFRRAALPTKVSCAFRLLKNRLFGARAPIAVMIGITYRCQCRCVHCGMKFYDVDPEHELTLEEVKSVIRQARQMGAVEITLFGGEPLLREDIKGIIGFARECRMLPSLDTNGILLTPEKIQKLMKAGLAAVKVSLDSPRADEHDRMRGVEGCFEKALGGIRECLRKGLPCVISTYASRENIQSGDLREMIELGRSLWVTAVRIIDTTLSGCFISSPSKTLSSAERDRLAGLLEPGFVFLENLASCRALTHPICSAVARRYVYISPLGEVQPCCFVPISFGNIRTENLRDIIGRIWSSSMMKYDRGQCLMNNPLFRDRYLRKLETAEKIPIRWKE